jgi:hypothetical protein
MFVVPALAVALALASCSDDGDDESSSTTPTTALNVATTLSDNPYCQTLQRFNERYGRINPGVGDPAQLRTALEDAVTSAKEAEAAAPPEIKGDLATMHTGLEQLVALFARANFDVAQVQANDLAQLESTPDLTAASGRVQAYTRDNCL